MYIRKEFFMKKKLFALCTIFSLIFVLCSCSPSLPGTKSLPSLFKKEPKTAKELLEEAQGKNKEIKSCHAEGKMTVNYPPLNSFGV